MGKLLTLFWLMVCASPLAAQQLNLVPDSSFEDNSGCPKMFSQLNLNAHWAQPTMGSADLYSACGTTEEKEVKKTTVKKKKKKKKAKKKKKGKLTAVYDNYVGVQGTPKNYFGFQYPRTGDSYGGFYLYYADNRKYVEYVATKLTAPLEKGKKYCLSYYISLADLSGFQVNSVGALFYADSNVPMGLSFTKFNKFKESLSQTNLSYVKVEPSLVNDISTYSDTTAWQLCGGTYIANGGETDLLIGAFSKTKPKHLKGGKTEYGYYYIDDVSLYETDDSVTCRCTVKQQVVEVDTVVAVVKDTVVAVKPYTIPNLYFDTDKWDIKPEAFTTLDSLVAYIKTLKGYRVEVAGYTDDVGDDKANKTLSENRAKAVADYLIKKGLNKAIVSYNGYGETQPVETGTSPAARAKNRRVTITLVRQK